METHLRSVAGGKLAHRNRAGHEIFKPDMGRGRLF
jgi:hypothetical protein